jgi:hypothetical protein
MANTRQAEKIFIENLEKTSRKDTFGIGCDADSWAALFMRKEAITVINDPSNITYTQAHNLGRCIAPDCCCVDQCVQIEPDHISITLELHDPFVGSATVVSADALEVKMTLYAPSLPLQKIVEADTVEMILSIHAPAIKTPSQPVNVNALRTIINTTIQTPTITP